MQSFRNYASLFSLTPQSIHPNPPHTYLHLLSQIHTKIPSLQSKKKSASQTIIHHFTDHNNSPSSLSGPDIAFVSKLFKINSQLMTASVSAADLPDWRIPEIAFCGRSNSGKSSLINALMMQKKLVRTSKTPGRTQQLNFFSVGGKKGSYPAMSVVDMPGYGFGNAPKRVVDTWHHLIGTYIKRRKRDQLKCVCIMIDSRRGMSALDFEFVDLLESLEAKYQIIMTKTDRVSETDLLKQTRQILKLRQLSSYSCMHPVVLATSAKSSSGIRELQYQIVQLSGLLSKTIV